MLPLETIVFLATGALLAGIAMGLVGFGTGLAALGFWLFVIDPRLAVPLVAICSLVTAAFTLKAYRHAISLRRLAPFILGGVIGMPLGVWLLALIEPALFKLIIGAFLILYTAFRLLVALPTLNLQGTAARVTDAVIGFVGGVLGGFAGIPGPITIVWCGLRSWSKDEQRAVYQPFNQFIILLALVLYGWKGMLTSELGGIALYCLPASLIGMGIGMLGYKRLDEAQFQRLVLVMLLVSGILLVAINR